MNLLNKKFPGNKFPTIHVHIFYFITALTFSYLYYHKFGHLFDFHNPVSTAGIYSVISFTAIKPMVYRILIPFIFKLLSFLPGASDNKVYFLILIIFIYLTILAFYFLLNAHFKNTYLNSWLAIGIILPMVWNLIILNSQFFFMDCAVVLFIVLCYYCIVTEKNNLFLLFFLLGTLNHPSIAYILFSYLLFNYKKLFKFRTIFDSIMMIVIYMSIPLIMNLFIKSVPGGQFWHLNYERNTWLLTNYPIHLIVRDFFLNFGGIYFFVILFAFSKSIWSFNKRYVYIHLMMIPYLISIYLTQSIEEMRNYAAIIPFVLILFLMYLSKFPETFISPVGEMLKKD